MLPVLSCTSIRAIRAFGTPGQRPQSRARQLPWLSTFGRNYSNARASPAKSKWGFTGVAQSSRLVKSSVISVYPSSAMQFLSGRGCIELRLTVLSYEELMQRT